MSSEIVPKDKFDLTACAQLAKVSDDMVALHIDALLECLQDLNWPIAGPVAERIQLLDERLVLPIRKILLGTDEFWKYWIVTYFLHHVRREVYEGLRFTLNRMLKHPTAEEILEEVHSVVEELIAQRR